MNITPYVELPDDQAWALAQFLKRVSFEDYRKLAASDEEAGQMFCAGEILRKALAEKGCAPR